MDNKKVVNLCDYKQKAESAKKQCVDDMHHAMTFFPVFWPYLWMKFWCGVATSAQRRGANDRDRHLVTDPS